eukprot:2130424-Rhodomonas_salina.1
MCIRDSDGAVSTRVERTTRVRRQGRGQGPQGAASKKEGKTVRVRCRIGGEEPRGCCVEEEGREREDAASRGQREKAHQKMACRLPKNGGCRQ